MYFDMHCHIFNQRIINNVRARPGIVDELRLNAIDASLRLEPHKLQDSAKFENVIACIILPSASPEKVVSENDRFYEITNRYDRIMTFATLHPGMNDLEKEIQRSFERKIRGFKFSSFSQRFDIQSPEMAIALRAIEKAGTKNDIVPIVIYDTYCKADERFGADPNHLTTPPGLAGIYPKYPGINFIGAHMGGLCAPFDDLKKYLQPAPNFYLDTSNAAHTLEPAQFVELLHIHGASHVLFGTDWPWFKHSDEIPFIRSLLLKANYSETDCSNVFKNNALNLMKML